MSELPKTREQIAAEKDAWLASLPPQQRSRLKRRETREKNRRAPVTLLIQILCLRSALAKPRPPFSSEREWKFSVERMRTELAGHQLRFEALMIKKLRLDHLDDVDHVYGIKHRVLKSPAPCTETKPAATENHS